MKVTEQMIEILIHDMNEAEIKTVKDQAVFISNRLNEMENICTVASKLHAKQSEILREYETKKKEVDVLIEKMRKDCRHLATTYHPDPSGNSDSYRECLTCGKEM